MYRKNRAPFPQEWDLDTVVGSVVAAYLLDGTGFCWVAWPALVDCPRAAQNSPLSLPAHWQDSTQLLMHSVHVGRPKAKWSLGLTQGSKVAKGRHTPGAWLGCSATGYLQCQRMCKSKKRQNIAQEYQQEPPFSCSVSLAPSADNV